MEDWRGQRVDRYYPSHKDLDESMYFHCLCQFCNIVLSPLIGASLTSIFCAVTDFLAGNTAVMFKRPKIRRIYFRFREINKQLKHLFNV